MKNVKVLLTTAIALTAVFSLGVQSNYVVSAEAATRYDCMIQQYGKEVYIQLEGNPTEGYKWKCDIKNPGIANITYQDYDSFNSIGGKNEDGGLYIWKFTGFWQGETEVTFTYGKDGDSEPEQIITYIVSVDSNLNVKFSKKEDASAPVHGNVQFEGNKDIIKDWKYQDNGTDIVDVEDNGISILNNQIMSKQKKRNWDVKGLKEGETEIKFIYDDSPVVKAYRTRTFSVKVDSDLNVTLSERKDNLEADKNVILLDGNGSTGYGWQYNIKDAEITKVTGHSCIFDDDSGMRIGKGETNAWAFEGLKEGETEVTFNYLRSWETEILKTVTYTIKVDADLNVTITQK